MRYEVINSPSDEGKRAQVTFCGDTEIEILAAVFSEYVQLARIGEVGMENREFVEYAANPYLPARREGREKTITCPDLSAKLLIDVFMNCHERTEAEVERIRTSGPLYLISRYEAERKILGQEAKEIADYLGKMAREATDVGEEERNSIISGFEQLLSESPQQDSQ